MRNNKNTKNDLIDRAIDLILSQGYTATTVDQICQEVQVSKGAFFHYFKNKEDLGKKALNRFAERNWRMVKEAPFQSLEDPLRRFVGYIEGMAQMAQDNNKIKGCMIALFTMELADVHQDFQQLCRHWFGRFQEMITSFINEANQYHKIDNVDAVELANYFTCLLQGSLILAKAQQNPTIMVNNLNHFKQYLYSLYQK